MGERGDLVKLHEQPGHVTPATESTSRAARPTPASRLQRWPGEPCRVSSTSAVAHSAIMRTGGTIVITEPNTCMTCPTVVPDERGGSVSRREYAVRSPPAADVREDRCDAPILSGWPLMRSPWPQCGRAPACACTRPAWSATSKA